MAGLAGIASGVDTDAIVDKLMEAESGKRLRMDWTKAQIDARGTALTSVQSKLTALRTALQGLRDVGTWGDKQDVSSTSTAVVAKRTAGAAAGGYVVQVDSLARAEQRAYDYTASASDTTLTIGSGSVTVPANATLADVVSAVNGQGLPVYASAAGGKLVLSSRATGAANGFTASGAGITEDAARYRAGADAQYRVDGGATQTSASNVVTDALPGIELTLRGVTTDATVTVGAPGVDKDGVKAKVDAFVTAYNDLLTTARGVLTEERVPRATTAADYAKGALRGDSGIAGLVDRLRSAISLPVAGNASGLDELRELGISTGAARSITSADALAGKLTLDADKLTAALEDPQAVRRLLGGVGGVDGFAQRLEGIVGEQLGLTGVITRRLGETGTARTTLQATMTREENRLAMVEKRYKAQFAAMETALANAQTQQSWLSGQLAALAG